MISRFESLLSSDKINQCKGVHITVGRPICMRTLKGDIENLDTHIVSEEDIAVFLETFLESYHQEMLKQQKFISFSKGYKTYGRLRFNIAYQRGTYTVNIEFPKSLEKLSSYRFPHELQCLTTEKSGLILLIGQSGSGRKSTVMHLLQEMNQKTCRSIVTLESPIEYLLPHSHGVIKQREMGLDFFSREEGIQFAIHEDTDILFVDDVNDDRTLGLALDAVERGILVIGVLHASTVDMGLRRLLHPSPTQDDYLRRLKVSKSLKAIIHQKIIEENTHSLPIFEVLIGTPLVENLILENKCDYIPEVINRSVDQGMLSFAEDLKKLHGKAIISDDCFQKYIHAESVH